MEPGTVSLPVGMARRIGTVGGDSIEIAGHQVGLDLLTNTYREAIPRRMRA